MPAPMRTSWSLSAIRGVERCGGEALAHGTCRASRCGRGRGRLPPGRIDLKDTYDFYGLVRKVRSQYAGPAPGARRRLCGRVKNTAFRAIVTGAADRAIPIMVFVGNKGMIKIHTGPVKKLMDARMVQRHRSRLQPAREGRRHRTELDRAQTTVDGMVTALECFDAKGSADRAAVRQAQARHTRTRGMARAGRRTRSAVEAGWTMRRAFVIIGLLSFVSLKAQLLLRVTR